MNLLQQLQTARRLLLEMDMRDSREFKEIESAILKTIKNLLAEVDS